ncbi:MAG: peptidyl-prolyl cis-trans isomerase [Planctomycetes bacterium]|nr:peptidyl-prolyl cis-trans isomerase [Planctomycetota bacterium]MCB9890507.1 peptidyl-prolyl cis-trans isomerase [Planctomycetota bacterium]MCB9917748.1 peptidyl-prolyl cis-trans isomerase [Planctomycetota bacterium]
MTTRTLAAVSIFIALVCPRATSQREDDAAFDRLLAAECARLNVGKNAVALARPLATKRFFDSGRKAGDDPDGELRRAFRIEALRKLRIDAIVKHDRGDDRRAVEALFEQRYGKDGERVVVEQVFVSLAATRERATREADERANLDDDTIRRLARERASSLAARASAAGYDSIIAESDDRTTRRLLRDPATRDRAAIVAGYDYRRFGEAFARAVRELVPGQHSGPVESTTGWHIVRLVSRTCTKFEDVAADLLAEVLRRQATPREVQALRKRLFDEHEARERKANGTPDRAGREVRHDRDTGVLLSCEAPPEA